MMLVYDLNRDRFDPVPAEASAEGRVYADQVVLAESFGFGTVPHRISGATETAFWTGGID